MNALLASLEGGPRDPKINHLTLSPIVKYWANVRELYEPFESGMRCGNAKVFEHQIPGGQYSNLMVQCKAMGLWDRWDEVVDMYRDVNRLFGDIIKVTPSSKVVGDMSLYLINVGLSTDDVMSGRAGDISWPDSVVNLCRVLLGTPSRTSAPKLSRWYLTCGAELKERPGGALPRGVFVSTQKRLASQDWPFTHRDVTDEDIVSSLLYETVFADYLEHVRKFGEVTWLPSSVFWYVVLWCTSATLLSNRISIISLLYHSPISLPSNTNTGTVCAQDKVPNFRFPRVFERTLEKSSSSDLEDFTFHDTCWSDFERYSKSVFDMSNER